MLLFSIIMQNIDQKKKTLMHQQYQMENNEFKKIRINNCKCYCFDDIIKLEDFDIDDILIDEKSHENILIYEVWYKLKLV